MAFVTAAKASRRPSPQTLLLPAEPPHVRLLTSMAVWSMMDSVPAMSRRNEGAPDQIRATVPATCGEAMEVPLKLAYELGGTLLRTFTPGAETSGLMEPSIPPGPLLENEAMLLLMSNAPAA